MAISKPDIGRLWGRAAGRCSFPTCGIDCLPFLDACVPTVIGEMAHVIPRSPSGARGHAEAGSDSYSNLILLCPTHHTMVDKASDGKFPEETLLKWKADHESHIKALLTSPVFPDRSSLDNFVRPKLIENRVCWTTYGPESETARRNPQSSVASLWPFRKLALMVPNNRGIISAVQTNARLFSATEYAIACQFVEHAEGFERNCSRASEDVPRFPKEFGAMFSE